MKLEVNEHLSSCKLAINAKGKWSGELKVYDTDSEQAMKQALGLADRLEKVLVIKNGGQVDLG